jgi:carboxyl-terminal processing protease
VLSGLPLLVAVYSQTASAPIPAAAPATEIVGHRTPKEYESAWTSIAKAIRGNYYGRRSHKDEMESLLKKYEPLAEAATDDVGFEDQVEKMIHEFGDSHFDFYTKADLGYYMMDGLAQGHNAEKAPMVGAWFRSTPAGYTVQMVLENSEAFKVGLHQGDRIVSADGEPFSPITSFLGKDGKKVSLSVKRGDSSFTVSVTPEEERPMEAFLKATRDSARIIDAGGKKYAYVHLWTQANDEFKSALANLVAGKFANTDGFILDIRDGFGGRPEGYGDPFFRPDVNINWDYVSMKDTEHFGYGKPLVLLINGGSRSAKEIFSYIMKASKRATLIGSTTAGNVLGTSPRRIAPWAILELPMVDVSVNGVRLEKNGVTPNIAVPDGYDSEGADQVIERAVKFLQQTK